MTSRSVEIYRAGHEAFNQRNFAGGAERFGLAVVRPATILRMLRA